MKTRGRSIDSVMKTGYVTDDSAIGALDDDLVDVPLPDCGTYLSRILECTSPGLWRGEYNFPEHS